MVYLYQGSQIPFIDYFGLPHCNNPSLTRTLSRVNVGDGIPMSSSLLFGDESCGSLVDEMSKAFLRSMGPLKVHESGELRRFGQPL